LQFRSNTELAKIEDTDFKNKIYVFRSKLIWSEKSARYIERFKIPDYYKYFVNA